MTHDDLIRCRDYVLEALRAQMKHRADWDGWVEREQFVVALAANQWAQAHGIAKRLTVEDVADIEPMAMGHVDYASKLALYVAESVLAVSS